MRAYEPWRALRSCDVPDGARERLLEGIDQRRSRSGRRGVYLVGAAAAAGIALLAVLHISSSSVRVAERPAAPAASGAGQGAAEASSPEHLRLRQHATSPAATNRDAHAEQAPALPVAKDGPVLDALTEPEPAAPVLAPERAPARRKKSVPRSSVSRSAFANSRQDAKAAISGQDLDLGATLLRRQIRAFRSARSLPSSASLTAWKQHRHRWPQSTLRREVDLSIIDVLRALGREIEARGEAAAFVRAHPDDRRSTKLRRFAEGP